MEYDVNMHLPQQLENLMQARAGGNLEAFEHIKKGIEQIIDDEIDMKEYEEKVKVIVKQCLGEIEKALKAEKNEVTLNTIKQLIATADEEYGAVWTGYVNDTAKFLIDYAKSLGEEPGKETG